MSHIRLVILNEIKRLSDFNKMNLKKVEVEEKEVLETDRMKKEYVFVVKIFFSLNKVIFDYFLIIFYSFIYRFKVFRTYINMTDNSFNFTLKLRNLEAVKELMTDESDK